jgi:hypothetical protein
MPDDDNDDLYDEEFDFVDDDDVEEEAEPTADDSDLVEDAPENGTTIDSEAENSEEPVDEYGRTEPAANYVVHVYEHKKFKRTIDRPFTPEDAEAFATEFNKTSKNYGRFAVTGKNDAKPKKSLD